MRADKVQVQVGNGRQSRVAHLKSVKLQSKTRDQNLTAKETKETHMYPCNYKPPKQNAVSAGGASERKERNEASKEQGEKYREERRERMKEGREGMKEGKKREGEGKEDAPKIVLVPYSSSAFVRMREPKLYS